MSEAVQESGAEPAPEVDRPNNPMIFGVVVVTIVVLLGVLVGVNELFKSTIDGEISAKVLEPPSSGLRSLRAEEQQRLGHYQWVSEKDGVLRIPVDRAVALTLKDYREGKRPAAEVKPVEPAKTEAPAKDDKAAPKPADSATPQSDKAAPKPAASAAPQADKPAPKPEGAAAETPVK